MFSLRALLLLSATIYLLPKEPAQQERFVASANQALGWATTFCQRQPDTCAQADVVWQDLKDKAHFGFGVAYGIVTRQLAGSDRAGSHDTRSWQIESAVQAPPRGTLTRADIEPRWRGEPAQARRER